MDRAVVALITKGETLALDKDGRLDDDTRKRLAQKVLERLNAFELHQQQRLRINDIIKTSTQQYADYIAAKTDNFKPYKMKW